MCVHTQRQTRTSPLHPCSTHPTLPLSRQDAYGRPFRSTQHIHTCLALGLNLCVCVCVCPGLDELLRREELGLLSACRVTGYAREGLSLWL